jgi:uncharacterized protein (DUF58 family)
LTLPFRSQLWRGIAGNWAGAGRGSSLDFQDHRPYAPGDDPRHINWQAYARTGHYTMKLYREEASPSVDLLIDVSASMRASPGKRSRSLELGCFAALAALEHGASLRACAFSGSWLQPLSAEEAVEGRLPLPPAGEPSPLATSKVPLRAGSMRVLVSDVLWPGAPAESLGGLVVRHGRGVVLCPWAAAEAEPDWLGNLELVDCESGAQRTQRVDAPVLERYQQAYARHFELWRGEARRHGIAFARVAEAGHLIDALAADALPAGALEPA